MEGLDRPGKAAGRRGLIDGRGGGGRNDQAAAVTKPVPQAAMKTVAHTLRDA